MNTALWIVQILLAIVFLITGVMKITQPKEKLVEKGLGSLEDFSSNTVHLIGVLEVLGAMGIVLPALTGILVWLTPLAAAGLTLTMIGAILTHLQRREYPTIIAPIIILALAVFAAYGRFITVPL